ncbi:MAG: T9SS type A sorting domain-containing protein [Agriterribacter sp.]
MIYPKRCTSLFALWCTICILTCAGAIAQPTVQTGILSFKAELSTRKLVQLNWVISCNRQDSTRMIIERSADGLSFQQLHAISFIADTPYQFIDELPLQDSGYYRLVCVTAGSEPVYSPVQKIKMLPASKVEISIMPNPVFNNASIIINNNEEVGDISCILYDLTGKSIRTYLFKKTGAYVQHILDMYSVPKGDYILTVRGNTINESKRILKQ